LNAENKEKSSREFVCILGCGTYKLEYILKSKTLYSAEALRLHQNKNFGLESFLIGFFSKKFSSAETDFLSFFHLIVVLMDKKLFKNTKNFLF